MFTWTSKFLYGLTICGVVGAIVYGLVTGGDPIGVVSAGYKGAVGEHFGYAMFLFGSAASFLLGTAAVMARDGDTEELAARAGVEAVPPVTPPADPAYWGLLLAFGVGCFIVGATLSNWFFYLGILVGLVTLVHWTIHAWTDAATGDVEVNRILRDRMLTPFAVPLLSAVAIASVVLGMSRIFLAAPSAIWSVIIGSIITVLVFGSAVLFSKVEVKRGVIAGAIMIGAVALLIGGIVSAAVGERDFHHGEAHSEEAQ